MIILWTFLIFFTFNSFTFELLENERVDWTNLTNPKTQENREACDLYNNLPAIFGAISVANQGNKKYLLELLNIHKVNINIYASLADCFHKSGPQEATPLTLALVGVKNGNLEVVQILLEHNADPNLCSRNDLRQFGDNIVLPVIETPPLNIAINENNLEAVKMLIHYGADVNLNPSNAISPLMSACYGNNISLSIVTLLLKSGAKINAINHKELTPLMYAAISNNIKCVALLLENGALINVTGSSNHTALMSAAKRGYVDMVNFLLRNGADPTVRNTDGFTALTYAEQINNEAIISILREVSDV